MSFFGLPPLNTNRQLALLVLVMFAAFGLIAWLVLGQFKKHGSGRHFVVAVAGGTAVLTVLAFGVLYAVTSMAGMMGD